MWKSINQFSDYVVSNYGRVMSSKRKIPIILSQIETRGGYLQVHLSIKGNQIKKSISRLVMETFNPLLNMNNLEVNHIDCNKKNNSLDNLEWVTHSENIKHAYNHGLLNKPKGELNYFSKLKEKDVKLILLLDDSLTYKEIGKMFGVSGDTISLIKRRKTWTHINIKGD